MYQSRYPWSSFKYIIEQDGAPSEVNQCSTPSISYENTNLKFNCETEGAEFHYTITDKDIINNGYCQDGVLPLAAAYNISVYASADGYTNSEKVSAVLYFVDGRLDADDTGMKAAKRGVLVSASGQDITVSGLNDGETVSLYNTSGMMLSTARVAAAGTVSLNAGNEHGVVIMKVGNESIKIALQ